jgi:hypothetical protein
MMAKQSEAMKLAKMAIKEREKDRLFALVTNPAVVAMGTLLGGIYLANHIRWDDDETRNTDVRAIAMAGTAIGSMAALGLRDKWILGGLGLAAGVAGLDPVNVPSVDNLTENYGLGSDARLFGQSVPGITPGHPLWEWALGPLQIPYDLARGKR